MSTTKRLDLSPESEIAEICQTVATDLSSLLDRLEVIRQQDERQKHWIRPLILKLEESKEVMIAIKTWLRQDDAKLWVEDTVTFYNRLQEDVQNIKTLSLVIGKITRTPDVSCLNFIGRAKIRKIEHTIRGIGGNIGMVTNLFEFDLKTQRMLVAIQKDQESLLERVPAMECPTSVGTS